MKNSYKKILFNTIFGIFILYHIAKFFFDSDGKAFLFSLPRYFYEVVYGLLLLYNLYSLYLKPKPSEEKEVVFKLETVRDRDMAQSSKAFNILLLPIIGFIIYIDPSYRIIGLIFVCFCLKEIHQSLQVKKSGILRVSDTTLQYSDGHSTQHIPIDTESSVKIYPNMIVVSTPTKKYQLLFLHISEEDRSLLKNWLVTHLPFEQI